MAVQITDSTISLEGLPTFEQFWASFLEGKKKFEQEMAENKVNFDRQLQKSREEFEKQSQEAKQRSQESDRKFEETRQFLEDLGRQMGGLHNSFGNLAEHLVAPGIVRRFNELGYHFDCIADRGLKFFDGAGNVKAEIDILLENGDCIIAVEVKSSPRIKDIEHHEKRLAILRSHRQGDTRAILGAIAGAAYTNDVKKAIANAGFYVLEQAGDTMLIDLPEGFEPKKW